MRKQWEQRQTFIFFGSRIPADGECSYEIKRFLLLESKVNDQPRQHIKKERHYFANKSPSSQSVVFPEVMYGYESWTIKLSAEELMLFNCGWEKTLESP